MKSTGHRNADTAPKQAVPADRLMASARTSPEGIEVVFADGRSGLISFTDLGNVRSLSDLNGIELPNPHEIILHHADGETSEIPWDFARHYCDPAYRARADAIAVRGRRAMGERVRRLRTAARMTQEQLASTAGIGRVTLVRIENGEQSPRYETLLALADALRLPLVNLLVDNAAA